MTKGTLKGTNIIKIRKAINFTRTQLAVRLTISEYTLYAYEHGTRIIPLLVQDRLVEIAESKGITVKV